MNLVWIAVACIAVAAAIIYARRGKDKTPVPGKDGDKRMATNTFLMSSGRALSPWFTSPATSPLKALSRRTKR